MADKLFPTDFIEITSTEVTDFTPVFREWDDMYKIKTENLKWPQGEKGDKWDPWTWSWDVVWPSSATTDRIATFNWTTWKLIKDWGKTIAEITPPIKASSSDINTWTDDAKYVTADALAGSNIGLTEFQLKICDDATVLTTGDGKIVFVVPESMNGMNLVKAHAMVSTVSSSWLPTVQIRNVTDSVDMLSTRITIDTNEYTSYTAATAPVIDTTKDDVATWDRIAVDVDVAGTDTKWLTIYLAFQTP